MRVIVEFDHNMDREALFSMAEEWLKHLVHQIKEKDHVAADEAAKQAHKQQIIQQEGPILWRSLADFIGKYVEDMKTDFHEDVTLREGPLTFTFQNQTQQIILSKTAFPYVNFTANPDYAHGVANMSYAFKNSKPEPNQGIAHTPIPCRFEVTEHHKVYLQLDGKPFHEASEAAKYLMEKLFTIKE